MSSYNAPTEDLPIFNTSLFNQPEDTLSQAEADLLYLSKVNTDTSTAPSTTFNGQVTINNSLDVGVPSTSSGFLNSRFRMRIYDLSLTIPTTNFTSLYMISGNEFVIGPDAIGDKVSVYIKDGTSTQIKRLEIEDAGTTITNDINLKQDLFLFDKSSPFTNTLQMSVSGAIATFTVYAGTTTSTNYIFQTYNTANTVRNSSTITNGTITIFDGVTFSTRIIRSTLTSSVGHFLFDNMIVGGLLTIGGTASTNLIRGNTTMSEDIIFSKTRNTSTFATYNGLTSAYIGYYSEVSVTFGVNINTAVQAQLGAVTSNIIGWFRCDFEVATLCGAAGSISKSKTFVSDNIISTTVPVGIAGAKYTNFATQTYAIGETSFENGSFLFLQDGTSKTLALQLIRTFATGTFTYTGSIRIVRMM